MRLTWNVITCWFLFPIWIQFNQSAQEHGFFWLLVWWLVFYCIVELWKYPVKKDIFGNEI